MKKLLKSRHRQLRRIALNIFGTFYAWTASLYCPENDFEGSVIMADEQEFAEEDEDVVGTCGHEETPLLYAPPQTTRIAPCKPGGPSGFSLARYWEINEFDPDMIAHFLIEEPEVPRRSVLLFELPVDFREGGATQTVSMVKVGDKPAGRLPVPGVIHVFSWFHGDLGV